jgi:hypothetical protein
MKRGNSGLGMIGLVGLVLCATACGGGDDDDATGSGGAIGSGGAAGMAGAPGTGGVIGSGGMPGSGGAIGSGGMPGTGGMTGSGGAMAMTGSPTFSAIFTEVIQGTGCNGGALCHAGTVGMLQMNDRDAAYMALVGKPAMGTNLPPAPMDCKDSMTTRVVPSDPDHSLLMLKITRMPPCGKPMPPSEPGLKPAQIEQIRTWIMNGAMND